MTNNKNCPLCNIEDIKFEYSDIRNDTYNCNCKRCGNFIASGKIVRWHDITEAYYPLLSGLVREMNEIGHIPEITPENIKELMSDYRIINTSDLERKAERFLSYLRNKSSFYGDTIIFNVNFDFIIPYCKNKTEFIALFKYLETQDLILNDDLHPISDNARGVIDETRVVITAKGWQKSSNLLTNQSSDQGFVASRFHENTVESIKAIESGIALANYKAMCIKEKHYTDTIMNKALAEIRKSRFVIIDLTDNRNAVSFEAGFAFALNKDCIYVRKEGDSTENFYAKHFKINEYSKSDDLIEIVKNAVEAIVGIKKN